MNNTDRVKLIKERYNIIVEKFLSLEDYAFLSDDIAVYLLRNTIFFLDRKNKYIYKYENDCLSFFCNLSDEIYCSNFIITGDNHNKMIFTDMLNKTVVVAYRDNDIFAIDKTFKLEESSVPVWITYDEKADNVYIGFFDENRAGGHICSLDEDRLNCLFSGDACISVRSIYFYSGSLIFFNNIDFSFYKYDLDTQNVSKLFSFSIETTLIAFGIDTNDLFWCIDEKNNLYKIDLSGELIFYVNLYDLGVVLPSGGFQKSLSFDNDVMVSVECRENIIYFLKI